MFSIVLATNRTKTLPVAIYNFISYAQIDWGGLMAGAVLSILPSIALFLILGRKAINSIQFSGYK